MTSSFFFANFLGVPPAKAVNKLTAMFTLLCLADLVAADDASVKGGAGTVIAIAVILGLFYCCYKLGSQVDCEAYRRAQAERENVQQDNAAQLEAELQRDREQARREADGYNDYIINKPGFFSTVT